MWRVLGCTRVGIDSLPELIDFRDGLDKVIAKAQTQCLFPFGGKIGNGDCRHRNILINLTDSAERLESVQPRHHKVEQDEYEIASVELLQELHAAGERSKLVMIPEYELE